MENSLSGTTSISQLPGNNMVPSGSEQPIQVQSNSNNVVLTKTEVVSDPNTQMQNPMMQQISSQPSEENKIDYNEMIKQLQQATKAGATGLPSRDIPADTNQIHADVQIKPNFVPETDNTDYIRNYQTQQDLISQSNTNQNNIDSLDSFYNEFQFPLLIAVLYFLFQLPIFRKTIKNFLPSLYGNDANPNLNGYMFNSVLFATIFYALVKIVNQLTLNIS
jgi:hypothetical protein|tara:strand:- start:10724 stop:11383 length:660 start_codon:yes stop_codon:yes gene_type:complete